MGVCKTLIILADLLFMYGLVYTASPICGAWGVCSSGVMLAIFSLVYCVFCTRRSKIPARGSLQNPYHTCRFAPYVRFGVHGVANLRRSIRVYQTLGFHSLKARRNDEPFLQTGAASWAA